MEVRAREEAGSCGGGGSLPLAVRELVAGGVTGGVAKTAVAPLERVKILFQAPQVLAQYEANLEESLKYTKELGTTIAGYKVTPDGSLLRVAGGPDTEADEADIKMSILDLGGTLVQCEAEENEV